MPLKLITNGRVLTALVMLTIFVVMTLLTLDYPRKASLMPLIVGIPGSILALIQLVVEIRTAMAEIPDLEAGGNDEGRKAEILMFSWIFLFFIGILCFGFVYAGPVLVLGFMYLGKKETLTTSIISGIATWGVLYGFFEQWFEIQLFSGLVIEHFLG